MISAVCLNPCLDKTVEIDAFTYGGMNRIKAQRIDASGKGVNVAIAAAQLGVPSACTGFLYRENGAIVEKRLLDAGAQSDFVWCDGAVRTNMKVLDRSKSVITEINESGVPASAEALDELKKHVAELAERSDIMVLTGSVPPGCADTVYYDLMKAAGNVRCVLDTEGEKLLQGLRAHPYMVKPNLFELETVAGRKLPEIRDILQAAKDLLQKGCSVVMVSMGADGACITNGKESYFAPPVDVPVRSTVGAGDSMVAAFCRADLQGLPLSELFRHAMAGGTASVMTEGTSLIDPVLFEQVLPRVVLQKVE